MLVAVVLAFVTGMLVSEWAHGDFAPLPRRVPLDPGCCNRDPGDETDVRHQITESHPSFRDDPPGVDWEAMGLQAKVPVMTSDHLEAQKLLASQGFAREVEHTS